MNIAFWEFVLFFKLFSIKLIFGQFFLFYSYISVLNNVFKNNNIFTNKQVMILPLKRLYYGLTLYERESEREIAAAITQTAHCLGLL